MHLGSNSSLYIANQHLQVQKVTTEDCNQAIKNEYLMFAEAVTKL